MKLALIIAIAMALACFTNASYNPPHFEQDDQRWGEERLGFGSYTIAEKGCFLSSTTSMIVAAGIRVNGRTPDPSTMNDWFKDNDGFDGGLLLFKAVEKLGFDYEGFLTRKSEIIGALNEGKRVILNVKNGRHWVLVIDYDSRGYTVMDSGYSGTDYDYDEVVKAAIYTAPKDRSVSEDSSATSDPEVTRSSSSSSDYNPPQLDQDDQKWGRERLGFGSHTIADKGCFLSATTSMLAAAGIRINGKVPTPSTMNSWFKANNGFKGGLLLFKAVEKLGFSNEGFLSRRSDITDALNDGKRVILNVKNGAHWVLATGYDGSAYTVMDPAGRVGAEYDYDEVVKAAIYTAPEDTSAPEEETAEPTPQPEQTPSSAPSSSNPVIAESLAANNKWRSAVGVPNLVWNTTLAESAQAWADHLASTKRISHSKNRVNTGENIAYGTSNTNSISDFVGLWGAESKYFVAGRDYPRCTRGSESDVWHYTQLVWAKSTQLGCGVGESNGRSYYVCQYYPRGNMLGQPVF